MLCLSKQNVERLAVYEWRDGEAQPRCLHSTYVKDPSSALRR
jgi:hypothetical protein